MSLVGEMTWKIVMHRNILNEMCCLKSDVLRINCEVTSCGRIIVGSVNFEWIRDGGRRLLIRAG